MHSNEDQSSVFRPDMQLEFPRIYRVNSPCLEPSILCGLCSFRDSVRDSIEIRDRFAILFLKD